MAYFSRKVKSVSYYTAINDIVTVNIPLRTLHLHSTETSNSGPIAASAWRQRKTKKICSEMGGCRTYRMCTGFRVTVRQIG